MIEDKQLIRRLQKGDADALSTIYETHKNDLLTLALSLLHDRAAAEDVLHDVFVSFASAAGRVQLRGTLRQYLTASIINRVRDRLRRRRTRTSKLEALEPAETESDNPHETAMRAEQTELLTAALGKLPLEQREVVVLRLNARMKFRDIAELQAVPLPTVQGRYRYGLEKLRTLLNGEMRS